MIINTSVQLPNVEVSLAKIDQNISTLVRWLQEKGISITPVTKGVCGAAPIAHLLSNHPIHSIGDSHIQNIRNMKQAGVDAKFMLLRAPMRHEVEEVIAHADYCLHSEIDTITRMNNAAEKYKKKHSIILMVELGDRREGILPQNIDKYISRILALKNIRLAGIGANLVCLNGIKPTIQKMDELSDMAHYIQDRYAMELEIVSGGNSANFQWFQEAHHPGMVNHLRMGEAVLLGTDPISRAKIEGLQDLAFQLAVEVIESKRKPSLPEGIPTYTAFGDIPQIKDEGEMDRAVLAIGLQDLDIKGCTPIDDRIQVIGATSDHMVVAAKGRTLRIGDTVRFNLTYRALLRLMISPYVSKKNA